MVINSLNKNIQFTFYVKGNNKFLFEIMHISKEIQHTAYWSTTYTRYTINEIFRNSNFGNAIRQNEFGKKVENKVLFSERATKYMNNINGKYYIQ